MMNHIDRYQVFSWSAWGSEPVAFPISEFKGQISVEEFENLQAVIKDTVNY